jgi:hypothetical protein
VDAGDCSAPAAEKKSIGRYANELKQAIEARWTEYRERAAQTARPAGPSTSRCPAASGRSAGVTR